MSQTAATATGQHTPPPAAAARVGLDALRAEWTKVRTVPETGWLVAATAVLTLAVSTAVLAATRCAPGTSCTADTTKLSLFGIQAGQAVVALLAVLAITSEYSTGMIRTTFTATPRRLAVLAAKAAVLTALVLPAAIISVAGCLLAGREMLPGRGFTTARGFALLSLAHGATLRAAVGSVLYLVLIGLLALGVATIVRDSAAGTGAVLGLLYLAPIIAVFIGNPVWQRRIERYGPTSAGLVIQDTTGGHLPIGPWGGLAVLAIWAGAALLAAGLLLRFRDV
jgi:ABC-2 type transport system permease protein